MFFNLSPIDRELKIKDISKLNQKEIGMSAAEKEREAIITSEHLSIS